MTNPFEKIGKITQQKGYLKEEESEAGPVGPELCQAAVHLNQTHSLALGPVGPRPHRTPPRALPEQDLWPPAFALPLTAQRR